MLFCVKDFMRLYGKKGNTVTRAMQGLHVPPHYSFLNKELMPNGISTRVRSRFCFVRAHCCCVLRVKS